MKSSWGDFLNFVIVFIPTGPIWDVQCSKGGPLSAISTHFKADVLRERKASSAVVRCVYNLLSLSNVGLN